MRDAHSARAVNNAHSGKGAKIDVRSRLLEWIGADKAHVFDAFAGAGEMHKAVWHRAASYTGCDKVWYRDERLMFVADNCRVMRSIDLAPFNVFDFDAYGSPWEQLTVLAARRRIAAGERIGIAITEGSALKLTNGQLPWALARLIGMTTKGGQGVGFRRFQDELIRRAVDEVSTRMGGLKIVKWWEGLGRTGAAMHYMALGFEAPPPAAPAVAPRRRRAREKETAS